MTWHVEVDRRRCMASGMCVALAPELFALDEDRSRPLRPDIEPDETALDAADSCPATAITVRDQSGEVIGPRDE